MYVCRLFKYGIGWYLLMRLLIVRIAFIHLWLSTAMFFKDSTNMEQSSESMAVLISWKLLPCKSRLKSCSDMADTVSIFCYLFSDWFLCITNYCSSSSHRQITKCAIFKRVKSECHHNIRLSTLPNHYGAVSLLFINNDKTSYFTKWRMLLFGSNLRVNVQNLNPNHEIVCDELIKEQRRLSWYFTAVSAELVSFVAFYWLWLYPG